MMTRLRFALALTSLLAGYPAHAQVSQGPVPGADSTPSPDPAADEAAELLALGRESLTQGKVEPACQRFAEAVAVHDSPEASLELGRCYELLGKTASAYQALVRAASHPAAGQAAERAREAASRLSSRLSRLRVLPPEGEGVVVTRNGVRLRPEQLFVSEALDPGTYTLRAEAPGKEPVSETVKLLADGDLKLVALSFSPSAPPPDEGVKKPEDAKATAGDGREGTSTLGVVGFVTSGFGLVGITLGTVFGIETLLDVGDAEDDPRLCAEKLCTVAGRRVIDDAESKGIASTVLLSVGTALLAAGVTTFVVDAMSEDDATAAKPGAVRIEPLIAPDAAGARATLRF